MSKLEEWLFNALTGKLAARAAVTVAAFVASAGAQTAFSKAGITGVQVDPTQLAAAMTLAAHAAYEAYKAWRSKPVATVPVPNT